MDKAYWFVFFSDNLLLCECEGYYCVPCQEEPPVALTEWNVVRTYAEMNGLPCKVVQIDHPLAEDSSYEMVGLRASYALLDQETYLKAGKGAEILYWDRNSRFCAVCGAPMKAHTVISKRCTVCGKEVWPQLATAIIVLVHRGDEILLVHAHNFKGSFYGLVAGFVETGETLEECVAREVHEETGLQIANIRYFASQPWPYPCGLMIGFHADYVSGEIHLQKRELASGGWFRRDNLPEIPPRLSMARMLIDAWLENKI